ncbi:MAG: hypothetical protein COA82_10790 [Alkaliphilus sp.]|nr:hypothetical protein [Alkaliphilus sp. AH-315-G20]MBN4074769.1 hypothetical protein [bacterium AH-315-E09]PHS30929.1 MAG: hypothetical protein COA82_10790 [Alkaliphilus sp.]
MLDDLVKRGKIKRANISEEMYLKEFNVGVKDLNTAVETFELGNYKWATIQSYYAIFHGELLLIHSILLYRYIKT